MKLKDKIKSYSFWVSIASAVILILKVLGSRFGFTVDESMVSDIFTALCSILVLMGIIVVPSNNQTGSAIKNINPPSDENLETISGQAQKIESSQKSNNQKSMTNLETKETTVQTEINNPTDTNDNVNLENSNTNTNKEKETNMTCVDSEPIQNNSENLKDINFEILEENTKIINSPTESITEIIDENFASGTNQNANNTCEFEGNANYSEESTQDNNKSLQTENNLDCQQNCFDDVENLKQKLESERKIFEGRVNEYLLILQDEINKLTQNMQ